MREKTVSEAIQYRRSVRIYDPKKPIDSELVKRCIKQASLAPSSSNLQLWEFYHVRSKDLLKKISKVCYNQPAAKTAQELVIPVVRLDLWTQRIKSNVDFIKESNKDEDEKKIKGTLDYYQKIIPKLLAIAKNRTDTRIYVRGDKTINYGRVLEIMGTLSGAGFSKVALISEPYKN